MIPDFLSSPPLFLRKISICLQNRVDSFLDFGSEGSAGTLDLTIAGENGFFNSVFDVLNPLKVP